MLQTFGSMGEISLAWIRWELWCDASFLDTVGEVGTWNNLVCAAILIGAAPQWAGEVSRVDQYELSYVQTDGVQSNQMWLYLSLLVSSPPHTLRSVLIYHLWYHLIMSLVTHSSALALPMVRIQIPLWLCSCYLRAKNWLSNPVRP